MTYDNTVKTNVRVVFALTLVHFTGDFYSSFISPLFPLFVEKLNLSLTHLGIVSGISRLLAFVVQPSAGYFADRYQNRIFILGGLLLTIIFIPMSDIAPYFWALLPCIIVGSTGSAMFHPSVTGMVPLYAGRKAGLVMSISNTGGTLAFAVDPLSLPGTSQHMDWRRFPGSCQSEYWQLSTCIAPFHDPVARA